MALAGFLLSTTLLGIATAEPDEVQPLLKYVSYIWGDHVSVDDAFHGAQKGSVAIVVAGLLWLYFFHMAVFTTIVAHAVSSWYFREEQSHTALKGFLGLPVMFSGYTICRYHLGSLACGS